MALLENWSSLQSWPVAFVAARWPFYTQWICNMKKHWMCQWWPGQPWCSSFPWISVLFNIAMENPLYMEVLIGKSSINGPCSMAMLVITRWSSFFFRGAILADDESESGYSFPKAEAWTTEALAHRWESPWDDGGLKTTVSVDAVYHQIATLFLESYHTQFVFLGHFLFSKPIFLKGGGVEDVHQQTWCS